MHRSAGLLWRNNKVVCDSGHPLVLNMNERCDSLCTLCHSHCSPDERNEYWGCSESCEYNLCLPCFTNNGGVSDASSEETSTLELSRIVRDGQRESEQWNEQWKEYCYSNRKSRYPSEHDDSSILAFLKGLPPQIWKQIRFPRDPTKMFGADARDSLIERHLPPALKQKQWFQDIWSRGICCHYLSGNCMHGDRCVLFHVETWNGRCRYGQRCHQRHGLCSNPEMSEVEERARPRSLERESRRSLERARKKPRTAASSSSFLDQEFAPPEEGDYWTCNKCDKGAKMPSSAKKCRQCQGLRQPYLSSDADSAL